MAVRMNDGELSVIVGAIITELAALLPYAVTAAVAAESLESIRAEMHSPEVVSDAPRLHVCYQNLQSAESRVQSLYARWAELEAKQM